MWRALWVWLKENHESVGAAAATAGVIVAAAGVIVAALYVRLTHRLATATHRQANLTATIAEQTRRQAEITQQIFEAGHRPYLELTFEGGEFIDEERLNLRFNVTNHGHVPAVN